MKNCARLGVTDPGSSFMKRDMDTIRSLLLKLEGLNQNAYRTLLINGAIPELAIEGASHEKIDYQLSLMREKA
jgi:hypothetical protein